MKPLLTSTLLLLASLLTACTSFAPQQKELELFVGGYTKGNGEGIYKFKLTPQGQLESLGLMAKVDNPSFLALSDDNRYLLAINEVDAKHEGFINSYAITEAGLSLLSKTSAGGIHPCFVTVNKNGQVITANYTGGSVALHQLSANGKLSAPLDVKQHHGSGVHWRQDKPHPHSAWFSSDPNEVIAVDLGTNELYFYQLTEENTQLAPQKGQARLAMEAGSGPRFLAVHPSLPYLYVLNELSSTVSQVAQLESGKRIIQSTLSTLPDSFKGENTSAHIEVSPDGRFLYVSNRGHNSIAVVEVDQVTGALRVKAHTATQGETPRNFALSPDGNWLLVANQNSNNLVLFKRDAKTGLLSYQTEAQADSPTSVVFLAN